LFIVPPKSFTIARKPGGSGNRQTFASQVGEVIFDDDVQDVSKCVEVASNGSNHEFSVPLTVLGLKVLSVRLFGEMSDWG
jgi:hypothetical protein